MKDYFDMKGQVALVTGCSSDERTGRSCDRLFEWIRGTDG